eukprot:4328963-Pyramimonas_sp.AAC.1
MSILFYNALTMFSGFLLYDAIFSSTYNVLFTFLPVVRDTIVTLGCPARRNGDTIVTRSAAPRVKTVTR